MSPTRRLAALVAGLAGAALLVPTALVVLGLLALACAVAADVRLARRRPQTWRAVPPTLVRGLPAGLTAGARLPGGGRARFRQAVPPDLRLSPSDAPDSLDATLVARRRGRHRIPPLAVRVTGPLGLASWDFRACGEAEVTVYPDLPGAARLAVAVRRGQFSESGPRGRGPLGLGTEFEAVRDYLPDDDLRQVNWRATARLGRPMSNQYRVDHDRDVVCCLDAGRLMASPLGTRTRLDVAVDAAVAVAAVADALGDHSGVVAFDQEVRRLLSPRRKGAGAVVAAVFDLEPSASDSDYELAFRSIGGGKRALVLVLTDLLDEGAARPLLEAVPVLARRHHVVVASARDDDLDRLVTDPPSRLLEVLEAAVAVDVLEARGRVVARLRRAGADVIEAPAAALPAACVGAYLRAKARARV